ncbi:MAG: right-handed parallel beta-helix repeat-containing protein, partial [bacterium]
TVVLRGGVYRVGDIILNNDIIIQPYQNEVPILKGSRIAQDWEKLNDVWAKEWNHFFKRNAPGWAYEGTPDYLWNLDMVFIDSVMLKRVGSVDAIDEGSFFIDYSTKKVYIGSNPNGKEVEITRNEFAFKRVENLSNFNGPSFKGITFMHYAQSAIIINNNVPNKALDYSKGEYSKFGNRVVNSLIENCKFLYNGEDGASLTGAGLEVKSCEVAYNGKHGLKINKADNGILENCHIHHNNIKGFARLDFPGAVKINNQTDNFLIKNNFIENNDGNGLWFDIGNRNFKVINNLVKNNSLSGIMYESSDYIIVAGNVCVGNKRDGIRMQNSAHATIYNNTVIASGGSYAVVILRTDRSCQNDNFGWHACTGPGLGNYENHTVFNNLLIDAELKQLYVTESNQACGIDLDYQVNYANYNHYQGEVNNAILWSPMKNGNCNSAINTLTEAREILNIESKGTQEISTDGSYPYFTSPETYDYSLTPESPHISSGLKLSEELASYLNWSSENRPNIGAYNQIISTGSLINNSKIEKYIIYPNPTSDVFRVNHVKSIKDEIELSIFNYSGEVIKYIQNYTMDSIIHFDSSLSTGVYFVQLSDKHSSQILKLIKL